ncbi:MAG: fused MFS/spermidine synthase [Thermodesulfovibrio sp.]|nr:fused MFS/spermidine synthase [Thermodesulfovibrio sp.]
MTFGIIKNSLRLAILIMGFSGLIAQMLLLRELLIVFSGNELSIGIIFANWVILEAFGCFFFGKRAEKSKNKFETFIALNIIFSIFLILAIFFTRILKELLGFSIGENIGFLQMLYSSFIILLPTSISHGALFPLSCKLYSDFSHDKASSIGKVYIYETIGTILGGIVWTYFLITYFHSFQIAFFLVILILLINIILIIIFWREFRLKKITTVITLTILIVSLYLTISAERIHQFSISAQWKGLNVVHYQNSLYGNISVVENEGQYIFFSDGIPELITPIPDIGFVEKFVHIPLFTHPQPQKLFILSGGAGGVINEILKHPSVKEIDYAELDPLFLEIIKKFPTPLTEYELNHKNVKVKYIDGRLFLKMTENRYDIILVGVFNPSDLQTNRLFTKEFFALAKKRLNNSGILVIGLPGSLRYFNDELKNLNSCIFNTLKSEFSYIRVFPAEGTNLFLASDSDEIIHFDSSKLLIRLNERGIHVNIPIARHIEEVLHPGWKEWFTMFFEGGTEKINSDFTPIGVFYSVSHWNSVFNPEIAKVFQLLEKMNLQMFIVLFFILILLFFLLPIKKTKLYRLGIPLCIMTTGFAGMIFDLMLIFAFQSIYGYVFSWIGLLVTFFMVGVSFGAFFTNSLLSRIKNLLSVFIKIDLTIIFFSLLMPVLFIMLHPHIDSSVEFIFLKILFLILSFISGSLVGAQFPIANMIYLEKSPSLSETAGILYSSDLIGGWISGVLGGIVLLPVLGLLNTAIVVVLLKLLSLIIIVYPTIAINVSERR